MKKMILAAALALATATAAAQPPPEKELTVAQALDVTAGLNQLNRFETTDKDGKAVAGFYKFSADLRMIIAINIDLGRRLQTQFQNASNDLVMQMLDPATGQVADSKRNVLNVETQKLMMAPARVGFHRIKREDLKLDENPIPGPVLSLIVPILDR